MAKTSSTRSLQDKAAPAKRQARAKRPAPAKSADGVTRDPVRERLLSAACELFSRRGVDAVTVRDLAEAAEVNVAAVNYYFGSKDGLLLVLFRREARVIVEQRLARLREAEASEGLASFREKRKPAWYPG